MSMSNAESDLYVASETDVDLDRRWTRPARENIEQLLVELAQAG
jgi:hypothetical protein